MVKFLLYLFESGLCLTILFLVYILFFRKETYFKFNRFYLLSIMFLSLVLPFMHINISVKNTQRYEYAINEIGKFKTYYEQLIAMTDPDYLSSLGRTENSDFDEFNQNQIASAESTMETSFLNNYTEHESMGVYKNTLHFSMSQFIFVIYLLGILLFLSRIFVLFHWIFKTVSNSIVEKSGGIKVVRLSKNLPPFSFLSYVFLSETVYSGSKSEQILEHEKTHIKQLHTIDLLIAHAMTILLWFNPFVWFLQKAIKSNHEYLADSKVVSKGYSLFDYQELLLNQFISIPSVHLVNNFNLISIKNRINMMNKTKSGFMAKFKALLIIPAALFAFVIFANLTLKSPGKALTNLSFFEIQDNLNQLKGMWINTSNSSYGIKVLFENSKFSVLDDFIMLNEYPYQLGKDHIILRSPNNEKIELKYEIAGSELRIWWNDEYSSYKKSNYNNSLEEYLSDIDPNIELPVIENYKLLQRLDLCIDVVMTSNKIFVNKKQISFEELEHALLKEKSKINHLNHNLITISLYADKNLSMKYMNDLQQTLRKIGLFKIAHMGKAADTKVSKLQMRYVGMPKRLPPLDAIIADSEELKKEGINMFDMDATDMNISMEAMKLSFKEAVSGSEKYIANLFYDQTTILNTYVGYQDMARSVIYDFRENYALEKYQVSYADLSYIQQNEIKKKYPLIISEAEAFTNKK
ncbi:MAG: hypothetical protein C0597_06495 [Marinilabiliales bacterium]|nr:MAG: hypothetical protein C0597_06495 [Marinilabiliales bacterium]